MNNNTFCTLFLVSSHIPLREASAQWSKQLLRIVGPEIIDQLKPREARFWHFENVILVARRREHFRGFLADFFVTELPQKKRCFNTQEFTLFLSTGVVSASSRAVTCPFKQSNPSVWSLLSWHPTHTRLWVRLSVFLKLFVFTVTVPPSDSDYVNRSASLQQFRLIHTRRARRSCSDEGGHQYQVLDLLNSNQFQYQWIGKLKKALKWNGPWSRFILKTNAPQARFVVKRLRRRQNLSKKIRSRQDFFDWILMGTLSSWCRM